MEAISTITYNIYQTFNDALNNHSIGISDKPDLVSLENSGKSKCKHWKVDTLLDAYSIERYFIEEYGIKTHPQIINTFSNHIYIYIY